MRTLIATMGSDERHASPAMQLLPHDRLIVVGSRDTFRSTAFRWLRTLEPEVLAVRVDPFNLRECLDAIARSAQNARKEGPVRISASGGTNILTIAAVLAAFHEGIEAWFCDGPPVRLPVLQGARLADAFPPAERAILVRLRRSMASEALVASLADLGFGRRTVLAAIRSLERKGLLQSSVRNGRPSIRPGPGLALIRTTLGEGPEKA